MKNKEGYCSVPRYRQESEIVHSEMGKEFCGKHWEERCRRSLKIDMMNKAGMVGTFNTDKTYSGNDAHQLKEENVTPHHFADSDGEMPGSSAVKGLPAILSELGIGVIS